MRYFMVLLLWCVGISIGWTQSGSYSLFLHHSELAQNGPAIAKSLTVDWPDNNCGPGGCYAILQFEYMPQEAEKTALAALGISLHDYIPDVSFLALYEGEGVVVLPDFVYRMVPLEAANKRSDDPLTVVPGPEGEDTYELLATPFLSDPPAALAAQLDRLGGEILALENGRIRFRIEADLLGDVQQCPALRFVEPAKGDPIPEGIASAGNIRVTDLRMQNGLLLNGANVHAAIGDDGSAYHLDLHGRYFDRAFVDEGTHGEMVAGMLAGAGWLNPVGRGAAPGASVHLFEIDDRLHLLNAVDNYNRYGICITNTSYGYECGESYSSVATDIDAQVYQLPALMHCFSAGNQGQNACFNQYGVLGATAEGTFWGNITGAVKSAKNVVAVGNVFWDDRVLLSSSRGPTPSGRTKPDIVGQGQGSWTLDRNNGYRISSGTSAASPNIAGGFALLYQGYRQLHGGQDPSSALIKALAMNTADDLGPAGPDFSSGYGRMNVAKAWECLEADYYFSSSLIHGQTQTFNLTIPANTERVKIMLYWHDAPASPLASRDLVNDLDLKVFAPNGEGRLPWAPSAVPHLDSLRQDARPRIDRINNVEQVVWDSPPPGTYTIEVKGHQVPSANQAYYVVYTVDSEPLRWVSPAAGNALVPGESAVLSWEATETTSPFQVEYSVNGGQSWQLVAANVPAELRNLRWQVPAVNTAQLRFRVLRTGEEAYSEDNSIIAPQVNFTVDGLNPQSAVIAWQGVSGAIAYDVFKLGTTEMERINRVSNLSYVVPVVSGETYWFTVAPVFAGDLVGRRAIAQEYVHHDCNREVRLQLHFDAHPEETSWRVLDASGNTLESGGPYPNQAPHSSLEDAFCLPEGCHTLVMQDAASNGMCCTSGFGSYRLIGAQGTVLVEGGAFTSFRPHLFCPEEGAPDDPLSANLELVRPISCAGQADGVLRVTAFGGTRDYEYYWSDGSQGEQLQYAGPGSYAVTVDDGNQAVILTTVLTAPEPLELSATTVPALCTDGQIVSMPQGGTAPYDLQWNTGDTDNFLDGLDGGDYFAILTDANNCLTTARFTVDQLAPLELELTTTDPSCPDPQGGRIEAQLSGGRGLASWAWSTGQVGVSSISGLSAGNYSLTVTDGGCQAQTSTRLSTPDSYELSVTSFNQNCANSTDGQIQVQPQGGVGPFTYIWNDGGNGSSRANLSAGTYQVWATDAEGCQATAWEVLTAPDPLLISASVSPASEAAGGMIEVEIYGGSPPYSLNWDHTTNMSHYLTNLSPGNYGLTVVDRNGCQTMASFIIEWISNDTPPIEYCTASGSNTSYEWIAGIALDGQHYNNGNDGGYGDYSYLVLDVAAGGVHTLTLKPGYRFTPYRESWSIWIDWNNDGDFYDEDESVAQEGPITGETTTFLSVPLHATLGHHRMRIAMQYALPASPCTNLTYGEIEDYTVNVAASGQNLQLAPPAVEVVFDDTFAPDFAIKIWPNPVMKDTRVQVDNVTGELLTYQLQDSQGRILDSGKWSVAKRTQTTFPLSLANYPRGIYYLFVIDGGNRQVKRIVKR